MLMKQNAAVSQKRPQQLAAPVRSVSVPGENLLLGLLIPSPCASSTLCKHKVSHTIVKATAKLRCPERSAGDGTNWVPTLSVKVQLDSMGARRRAGLRGAGLARTPGRARRAGAKQLKARRLSFTWQMHNSQGSPGDQICPIGNSTPLSSREQPGQGTVREEGQVGRDAVEGPECPPTYSTSHQGQAPLLTLCRQLLGVHSTQGLPTAAARHPHLVGFPSQHAPGIHRHAPTNIRFHTPPQTHTVTYRATATLSHTHSRTHTHKYTCTLTHTRTLKITPQSQRVQLSLPPEGIPTCTGCSPGTLQGWGPHLSRAWAPGS